MNDENVRGKFRQRNNQPLSNPELPEHKDWWDEVCKAAGETNYFPNKETRKREENNED